MSFFWIWCLTLIVNIVLAQFDPTQHANWNLLDNENCGSPKTSRVIGGDITQLGEFPWIARLVFSGSNNCSEELCGGAIINNKTILTTTHCVIPFEDCKLSEIVLGDWNKDTAADCENNICSDPIQSIKPKDMLYHSAYNETGLKNDIALVRLEKEIQYNSYVRPICMVKGSLMQSSFLGNTTVFAGWGDTDNELQEMSPKLLKVNLPVVDFSICQNTSKYMTPTPDKQLCAGGEENKDTCTGDSGGPLMLLASENGPSRFYVIGVSSFGPELCGGLNKPSVFTRVSAYMEWILDNLKENKKDFTLVV